MTKAILRIKKRIGKKERSRLRDEEWAEGERARERKRASKPLMELGVL